MHWTKSITPLALGLTLAAAPASAAERSATPPMPVVLDTDMWGDIDDVLALAALHALEDRGEARILAITSSTSDKWCAAFIDLVDTYYGRPGIPVGLVHDGVAPPPRWAGDGSPMAAGAPMYTEYLAKLRGPDGAPRYPHALTDDDKAPEAVALLRRTLAAQPDGSVVVISIGFSTNMARLLDSKPDRYSPLSGVDLVKRKVRLLSVMAGRFADARYGEEAISRDWPEYNVRKDIPSARKLFRDWPTPIVASGSEVGFMMRLKGSDVESKFAYDEGHPVPVTYRYMDQTYRSSTASGGVLHDHKTFDLTSVLYAVRPNDGYFTVSEPGEIDVLANGATRFEPSAGGKARYLAVTEDQRVRALEAMTQLTSQPPRRGAAKTRKK